MTISAMRILILIFASLISLSLSGQDESDSNLVFWSSTRKLTVEDFGIKTKNNESNSSYGQFSVDYRVNGFDFMTKNFNNKVRNYLIKSASAIDTTLDVRASLRYQQTLFDLSEIYTRHFRKDLKENRKKIASGTQFIDGLNQKAMTDFSNRKVQYDRDTNFGTNLEKQVEWENTIKKELAELSEFSNE